MMETTMPKTDDHFTKAHLQSLFTYADGHLYWKDRKGRRTAGTLAGTPSHHYHQICIDYKLYRAHRLIWAFHNGPSQISIDHINGDAFDNRIENLRECTTNENHHNSKRPKSNTSGVKGVSWCKQKQKWRARIGVDGKEFHIGFFNSVKEAEKTIAKKRDQLHGVFARNV
jgi:hypothetical protein